MSELVAAVEALFREGGALARGVGHERATEAQVRMAQAVARVAERSGVLVVEAGTGVGKSWAYLAPLLLGGQRAWLSTATHALQEQLFQRDIPALCRALGRPVKVALLKGRRHYVCVQRVAMLRSGQLPTGQTDPAWAAALERVGQWAERSLNGDLAELRDLGDDAPIRPWITSTRDNCLGQACPRWSDCHVNRARRLAQDADWVVINHHLFLASQQRSDDDGLALLPPTDVMVFDEAHRLLALGDGLLVPSVGARELLDLARELQSQGPLWARGMQAWAHHALVLQQASGQLALLRARQRAPSPQSLWVGGVPSGFAPDAWQRARSEVAMALQGAAMALAPVAGAAAPLERLGERAVWLLQQWRALVADGAPGEEDEAVRWIDWGPDGQWRVSRSAPAAESRWRALIAGQGAARSCVFTSATLGIDDGLSWFTLGMGLKGRPDVAVERLPSPFDHSNQAKLYVPSGLPAASDERHSEALAHEVARWATALGGRTLVLTTSMRACQRIAAVLRERLLHGPRGAGLQVLSQGQGARRALLERFRDAPAQSAGAVLVASGAFWEGVDLAGDVLQLLVIDKLPFPSPGDPMTQVRLLKARAQGDDPFLRGYLHPAGLALKQGAGRLIRSVSDQGVLVIADGRAVTQSYGPTLLAVLPDMPRLTSEEEMFDALHRLAQARSE